MKNKGLIITLIILLSIIVLFLIMFLIASINGEINFKKGMISIGSRSSTIIFDETYNLEDIKSIDIKQNAGDIIFEETSDDNIKVVVYGEYEDDVNVNLRDNKLTIDYTHKNKFVLFGLGTIKNNIIVYVPSSYSNEIKIKNDYGNIEMADLENATVNIDSDYGNVELGKIKDAIIKCDYGNIEVKEILNKCDIKADCGNIEIDKISIKENSSIKADLGNVDIHDINDIYIDADVDLGKSNINKNNRNSNITLKINCDCGNINVGK